MVYVVSWERNEGGFLRWNMEAFSDKESAFALAAEIRSEWDEVLIEAGSSVWTCQPIERYTREA